jgi:hypothetical protein
MPSHSHPLSGQSNNDNGFGKYSSGTVHSEGTNP